MCGEAGGWGAENGGCGGVGSDGDVGVFVEEAEEEAVVADGVGEVGATAPVLGREDAFGAAEELDDFADAEAGAEALPDVGAQAVAIHEADFVLFVQGIWGGSEEVAGGLADVHERCGTRVADIGPEGAGGERFADGEGHTREEVEEGGDATRAVVKGHAIVPSVALWAGGLAVDATAKGSLNEESGCGEGAGFG